MASSRLAFLGRFVRARTIAKLSTLRTSTRFARTGIALRQRAFSTNAEQAPNAADAAASSNSGGGQQQQTGEGYEGPLRPGSVSTGWLAYAAAVFGYWAQYIFLDDRNIPEGRPSNSVQLNRLKAGVNMNDYLFPGLETFTENNYKAVMVSGLLSQAAVDGDDEDLAVSRGSKSGGSDVTATAGAIKRAAYQCLSVFAEVKAPGWRDRFCRDDAIALPLLEDGLRSDSDVILWNSVYTLAILAEKGKLPSLLQGRSPPSPSLSPSNDIEDRRLGSLLATIGAIVPNIPPNYPLYSEMMTPMARLLRALAEDSSAWKHVVPTRGFLEAMYAHENGRTALRDDAHRALLSLQKVAPADPPPAPAPLLPLEWQTLLTKCGVAALVGVGWGWLRATAFGLRRKIPAAAARPFMRRSMLLAPIGGVLFVLADPSSPLYRTIMGQGGVPALRPLIEAAPNASEGERNTKKYTRWAVLGGIAAAYATGGLVLLKNAPYSLMPYILAHYFSAGTKGQEVDAFEISRKLEQNELKRAEQELTAERKK